MKQLDRELKDWPVEAPTLIVIGESDIVRPEHAVKRFRLLDGGVAGATGELYHLDRKKPGTGLLG